MIRNEADVTTAVATSSPLTSADRCDRCGAQAYLRVELRSGGDLLFCAPRPRARREAQGAGRLHHRRDAQALRQEELNPTELLFTPEAPDVCPGPPAVL